MKKFSIVLLVGIFLFGLGITPCGAQDVKKLKVGHIGSFTGPLAPMLTTTRNGAFLAQKHINEDGGFVVAGQRYLLELVACDDRTDPKVAVSCALRLMDEHDIKISVGPMMSSGTIAVQAISEPRKVILINFSSAKEIIRPGIKYTLNGTTNREVIAKFLPPFYVNDMGIKTCAFIVENAAAPLSMYNTLAPAFEAQGCKVFKETYEPGETDFFSILTRLKKQNPDALFLATYPVGGSLITKQRLEIGWPVQTIGEAENVASSEFFRVTGPAVEGHIDINSLNPWMKLTPELIELTGLDPKKRERFNRDYIKEYGEKARVGGVDDAGYDHVSLAVEMMKRAGTITDTDKMLQAARASEYRGVLGAIKVSPLGRMENRGFISLFHPSDKPDKAEVLAVWWTTNIDKMEYGIKFVKKPPRIEEIRKQRGY